MAIIVNVSRPFVRLRIQQHVFVLFFSFFVSYERLINVYSIFPNYTFFFSVMDLNFEGFFYISFGGKSQMDEYVGEHCERSERDYEKNRAKDKPIRNILLLIHLGLGRFGYNIVLVDE